MCLAWRGEGGVQSVELGPGEGGGVLLPDAQLDRGGEAGLPGEVSVGLGQAEEREEKHGHSHSHRSDWLTVSVYS